MSPCVKTGCFVPYISRCRSACVAVALPIAALLFAGTTTHAADKPAPKAVAAFEITSPVKGDQWAVGSSHYITWRSAGGQPADTKLKIELSRDAGKTWTDLGSESISAGRLMWKVTEPVASQVALRAVEGNAAIANSEFALIASQEVPEYQWKPINEKAPFAPRDGAGALTFKNQMWFIGGWNPGDKKHFPLICNNEVWSSSDGAKWTLVKPNTFLDRKFDPKSDWEGRHTAGYVVYRDKMWIVGGDANQGHYQNDVWNSADGKTWTLVSAERKMPWPRVLHYTVVHKDKIWVLGGQTMGSFASGADEKFYRDIWTTTDGVNWEEIKPQEPYWSKRGMMQGSVVFKDRVWFLGGGTYDTPTVKYRNFYNDVWSSADGVKWTQHVASAPWFPRQYHEVAVYDDRMWVLEGYNAQGGNRKDVWYSADGVNWYEVPNTPWKPRHAASVYVHDGGLWMVAGNNMQSDVWKLQRMKDAK